MPSLTIRGLGGVVTGRTGPAAFRPVRCLHVRDGAVATIGDEALPADTVVEAGGAIAIPGLIDSHSHPLIGEWSPVLNSIGWITHYLHGGVTTFISAGEVVMPGFPVDPPDPGFVRNLALVTKKSFDALRAAGARVLAGTPVLVSGLTEQDFDLFRAAGIRLVKFIYYDYERAPAGESRRYVAWARERGMKVKLHAGGTSYLGDSAPAGIERTLELAPDIVAHLNGGPIPPPPREVERIVRETTCAYEIVPGGNPRVTELILRLTRELGCVDPSCSGPTPRGGPARCHGRCCA
jgi:enamidase